MTDHNTGDYITLETDAGDTKEYKVDALFTMKEQSYAMLSSDNGKETIVMRVEEEGDNQFLESVSEQEMESILDAYQIAMEANDDDENKLIH